MIKRKIEDFGEKLGGARKDDWSDGITSKILENLTEEEAREYVTRDNVFPLPNAVRQVEKEGIEVFAAYFIRYARRCLIKAPKLNSDTVLDEIRLYVKEAENFKAQVLKLRTEKDIERLSSNWREYFDTKGKKYISYEKLYNFFRNFGWHKHNCAKTEFPYLSKESKERKKCFIPPQLDAVKRTGKDYLHGRNVDEYLWQNTLEFRGVEFGNWTSQKHRQVSLNYAYEALLDLAVVLNVENTDVAFGRSLGLGFGSRGRSGASAHYEPLREVINLTKMHGAGCLAHEWAHALDDKIGKFYGSEPNKLASESLNKTMLPNSFCELITAMKIAENGEYTDFYRGSARFDKGFRKDSHGYWSSSCEMFARAFACYVKDTCDFRSDYLFAQADTYVFEFEDMKACAIPQGEEREIINELFDQLIYDLKKDGFFTKRKPEPMPEATHVAESSGMYYQFNLVDDVNGQMRLLL